MHLREPFPLRTYLGLSLLGLGCGLAGALSGSTVAASLAHRAVPADPPTVDVAAPAETIAISSSARAHTERLPAPSTKPGFVIEIAGAHYLVLDVDATTVTHHRPLRLVPADYPTDALVTLRDRDLTPELRAWRGQQVSVDGGACTDTLDELALVSQVSGDPVYAGDTETGDTDDQTGDLPRLPRWTVATIEQTGSHLVVAKLAHCTGTFARAASAPPAVVFAAHDDAALAQRAEAQLLHSPTADAARAALKQQYGDVAPDPESSFDKVTEISTKVATDPRTGTAWVMVHAHAEFSCGGPQVNFWGLYRVDGDALVTVREAALEDVSAIDQLVDLDGDGVPELLGAGWITPGRAFYDQDFQTVVTYDVPFFGCPC